MKRVFIACGAFALIMMVACTESAKTETSTASEATTETNTTDGDVVATISDIAYVDIDAALSKCDIYTTEGVALQKKTTKAQSSWEQKEQQLQADAAKLQDKYQRGLITTANAQLEQEKLQQKAVQYQNTAQTELQKLDEENAVFTNRTRDLIRRAVDEINSDRRYKLIVNASALIDADTTLNITDRVVEVINRLYAEDNKK